MNCCQEVNKRITMAKEAFNRKRSIFCGPLKKKTEQHVKWTDKIKNVVLLETVGEGRIMLELIKKRKINCLGHWLRRN